MSSLVGIGLIGFGYWGKKIYKYLEHSKRFECRWVYGRSLKVRGIYTNSLCNILNDKCTRAVIVATPIGTHYKITKRCLLAHKSVLCEKPLTLEVEQAKELIRIAQERRLQLVTEFTYTFSKSLKDIQNKMKEIGQLRYIEMRAMQWGRFNKFDTYTLLGTHMLSIVDMFKPLSTFIIERRDCITRGKAETGLIFLKGSSIKVSILSSLNSKEKEFKVTFYGTKGSFVYSAVHNYKEKNNLKYALEYFYNVLIRKEKSNTQRALRVTRLLDVLRNI